MTERIPDQLFIDAFDTRRGDCLVAVMGAGQVADVVGCARQTAQRRLETLGDEGVVRKWELGARSVAWQYPCNPNQ